MGRIGRKGAGAGNEAGDMRPVRCTASMTTCFPIVSDNPASQHKLVNCHKPVENAITSERRSRRRATQLHRHISPWGVVRDATSSPHQHSIRLATPFILHSIPEKTSVASLPFPTPYPLMETTPGASRLSFKGAMLDTSNGTELTDFLCCDEKNGPAGKP